MRIAITSSGQTLDAQVESRFGRCAYFLIVDTDSMELEGVENPNSAVGGGAGIQSAQLMAEKGVQTVLTGNCGPNAHRVFGAAGIEVIVGVSGSIRNAIDQYKQGTLTATSEPNVASHFGMGAAGGTAGFQSGRGMGGGRGMGMGMGRGMGMGGGMQTGPGAAMGDAPVEALKAEAEAVEEKLAATHEKIAKMGRSDKLSTLVAVVDQDKCVGCGVCVDACSEDAVHMNEVAVLDTGKCTGCGSCVVACEQDALSLHGRS